MDSILASVTKHNKVLIAAGKQGDAQKLKYNTGIYPGNPFIEYDFMRGSPAGAGNQTDILIVQPFDFPSLYIKRKQIASRQTAQIDFHTASLRQDILLEAKQACIQLIFLNKRQKELGERWKNIESLYGSYQAKLEKGDASVLELNRIKLQLLNIKTDVQLNQAEIIQANLKLSQLNGGNSLSFTTESYAPLPEIPDLKTLENAIETVDPMLKYFEKQKEIYGMELQLGKALWLPKFETGYHQQAILGQKFQGIHIGISIPLWEQKNSLSYQKALVIFGESQIEEHRNRHYHHVKQLYEKSLQLQANLAEYMIVLKDFNSSELLRKALALGQISLIEYALEISNYYDSYDKFLALEKEYHDTIAALFKFTL